MPSTLRSYTVEPGEEITIEIEQPDGEGAVVVGTVDSIPHSYWRGRVLELRIADARAAALPPKVTWRFAILCPGGLAARGVAHTARAATAARPARAVVGDG